jgi:peptidoglycan/LPS O-acetylase OafA/YrhL
MRAQTLDEAFDPEANAFDFLRVTLAALVIVSHAFLTAGRTDPISDWSGRQENLGGVAVDAFFCISGFLVARSRARTSDVRRFLLHRALRIAPAFAAAVLVVAFGFGPLWAWLERGALPSGFFDAALDWVRDSFLFRTDQDSGFAGLLRGNPVAGWVDAPLWTLRYECICYALLALLGWLGLLDAERPAAVALACGAAWLLHALDSAMPGIGAAMSGGLASAELLRLSAFFFAGAFAWHWRKSLLASPRVAAASGALLVAALRVGGFQLVAPAALTCLVLWLACRLPLRRLGRADTSYGLYLFGFPIQQTFVLVGLHNLGMPAFIALSLAAAWVLALLSHALVETPFLALKRAPSRSPASKVQPELAA